MAQPPTTPLPLRRRTLIGAGLAVVAAAVGIPAAIVATRGGGESSGQPSLDPVTSVALTPDGTTLATASYLSTVVGLWDGLTGRPIRALAVPPATPGATEQRDARALAVSPDGRVLAIGCDDGTLRRYAFATEMLAPPMSGHTRDINSVAYSPDGKLIASAGTDQIAVLWDAATGRSTAIITAHTDTVWAVAFSPDGEILATASADGTIGLWSTPTGTAVRTLTSGSGAGLVEIAFTPDGRQLLATDDKATRDLHWWDLATGVHSTTRPGHGDALSAVAVSPDGATIATGSFDETIVLTDRATTRTIATLHGHTGQIAALQFSHDGARLASGSYDGTAKLWSVALGRSLFTVSGNVSASTPPS